MVFCRSCLHCRYTFVGTVEGGRHRTDSTVVERSMKVARARTRLRSIRSMRNTKLGSLGKRGPGEANRLEYSEGGCMLYESKPRQAEDPEIGLCMSSCVSARHNALPRCGAVCTRASFTRHGGVSVLMASSRYVVKVDGASFATE